MGFNGFKAIEVEDLLCAVIGETTSGPDFAEGYEIQTLVEPTYRSSRERRWVTVG